MKKENRLFVETASKQSSEDRADPTFNVRALSCDSVGYSAFWLRGLCLPVLKP